MSASHINTIQTLRSLVWSLPASLSKDQTIAWAIDQVRRSCATSGIAFGPLGDDRPRADLELHLVHDRAIPAEGYRWQQTKGRIDLAGSDARGLAYGLTELAASLASGTLDANGETSLTEQPATPVRGIARSFSSVDEDRGWFHDRTFWTQYLDEMATCRFNRFHLALGMQFNYGTIDPGLVDNYFAFAYPFLLDLPGHSVRVEGLDPSERDRNLTALRHIARETRRRGMQFSLGLWTHAYAFPHPSRHRFPIIGVGEANHAEYCAAALGRLLEEIPEIDALTFRVHFEAGIREATQHLFWDQIFAAIAAAGRPIAVDLHAKGVGPDLLAAARRRGIDVTLSGKYWAEHLGLPYHQAAIREKETARPVPPGETMSSLASYSRLFTRYGYADYLGEDEDTAFIFRMWPGTQKLLLWGDPAFAAGYGRNGTFGGARGVEFCEPLFFKGRKGGKPDGHDPYIDDALRLGHADWQKYHYTYLLWGRLLYNPDASPETWRRLLRSDYGGAAEAVEQGLGALSRILPLVSVVHGVSGANNLYWPEIYVDLPISAWVHQPHYDKNYEWDNSAPQNWGRVSPFDPAMFYAINQYASALVAGKTDARYTPLEVAAWLDDMVASGEDAITRIADHPDMSGPQGQRTLVDMQILARLGRFFAGKFRAAFAYALYEATRDGAAVKAVQTHLQQAHDAFAGIVPIAKGVYKSDLIFGTELSEHGHWSRRLKAMEDDLRAINLESERGKADPHAPFAGFWGQARTNRNLPGGLSHAPMPFERNAALNIGLTAPDSVQAVTLHVRPVDQSARYLTIDMDRTGNGFEAIIPPSLTSTGFPLLYYFEVSTPEGSVLYPGFDTNLANQPYFSVPSTKNGQGMT